MRQIIYIFLLCCLVLQLSAQENEEKKPATLVFHFFYNDFNTAQQIRTTSLKNVLDNHLWSKFGQMQMGFGFNYLNGIRSKIDFVASLDGSSTDYLYKDGTTHGSSAFLLDANAGVNLKLLTDRHKVVPYFSAGLGASLYNGKSGFYLPLGAGIQFNLFKEAFVLANVQYRNALTSVVNNHFQYNIGVGASLGKKKAKPVKAEEPVIVPVPVKKEIIDLTKDFVIAVKDEVTDKPLPYVEVVVSGSEGKKISGTTDADGRVTFKALSPADYTVSGLLNNINTAVLPIKKDSFETNNKQLNFTLTHNDPRFTLSGIVVNKTKNIPEGGAEINVANETRSSNVTRQSHASDGIFRVQLEAGSDFTVVGKKANYISNIEKVSTKGLNRSATLYVKLELRIEEAKAGQSIQLSNIYFETGKANLNTTVSSDLDRLIQFLKDNPASRLEIQGHTDNIGGLEVNDRLSQSRANSVVDYLTKKGIDRNRLIARGYGPSLPVADNATAEGRTKNRRVVMKVIQ
ncbi:MAG: OmpA family protein [Prolixibacteraceae bacterium]|nr:OmpA family protein [Prolixibacteraceae bacterium]